MNAQRAMTARAYICGENGIHGMVRFRSCGNGVLVTAEIHGLPKTEHGFFGFHIHEGCDCGGTDFSNTASHYNPFLEQHPQHAGDLPPLLGCNGSAFLQAYTDRFTLCEIIGRTVVIHSQPDDFKTQPSGAAGNKIACGVIMLEKT